MVTMADKEEDIHKIALNRFGRVEDKERDDRSLSVEDHRFAQVEDGQWDENAKVKRANRPRYTVNRISGAIEQLKGDQRQNRTSIKIRPVSGGATEEVAKVMEGIIRNIESQSKAENAYDNAFSEIVNGGYGGWRVITEFPDDDVFEQQIRIKAIKGANTSLWFDPGADEYDKSDAMWAFVTLEMTKEEREERWPDKPIVTWNQDQMHYSGCRTWFKDDMIRVAEYWYKVPVTRNLALLSDGRVIDEDEDGAVLDELATKGVTVVRRRKAKSFKVKMAIMDGGGILEEPKDWAGKFIPLIPVYGIESFIEGETHIRGIVRQAKDSQRIYNYATSAAIETAALTPKDPIWITAKQAQGHEERLSKFNTSNSPFLFYNADPSAPGTPQRGGAPAVQGAFIQQIQQASMDLYHVTGMQPPSLGTNPELKSGKAIQAQERLGDRSSYVFSDNLAKSIEYTAEVLVDLIPRIMDTQQQVRIMQQDGETEQVFVNEAVIDEQTGEEVLVNDLSMGKYDVVAETGPAFATQRQESAQQIIDLISTSPQFEALAMDLVAKDLPILESKELTKRVRKVMIGQGIVEPTEQEIQDLGLDQPQKLDPQQQAITENIQIQTEKLISDIENQEAKTLETQVKAQQATIETYEKMIETFKTQMEAGIPLTQDDHNMRVKQQDIILEGQQAIDPGPNREQAESIVNDLANQQQVLSPEQQDAEGARRLTVEQPSTSIGQDNL
jgi:hypothetical protein